MKPNRLSAAVRMNARYAALQIGYCITFAMVNACASPFLLAKGFENTAIGMALAIAALLSIPLQQAAAALADRPGGLGARGINNVLLAASLAIALAMWRLPLGKGATAVLYVLINVLVLSTMPLVNAMGMALIERGLPVNFGLGRGIGSISYGISIYIIGLLMANDPLGALQMAYVVTAAFFLLASATFPRVSAAEPGASPGEGSDAAESPLAFLRRYPRFGILLLGQVLLFAFHYAFNNYMLQIIVHLGGDSVLFGKCSFYMAALELPMMGCFALLLKKFSSAALLRFACVAFTVKAALIFLLPNMLGLFLSLTMQFFALAMVLPAMVHYTSECMRPADKVKGQAYFSVAMCLGSVAGSMGGGVVLDHAGVPALLLVITLVSAAGSAVALAGIQGTAGKAG